MAGVGFVSSACGRACGFMGITSAGNTASAEAYRDKVLCVSGQYGFPCTKLFRANTWRNVLPVTAHETVPAESRLPKQYNQHRWRAEDRRRHTSAAGAPDGPDPATLRQNRSLRQTPGYCEFTRSPAGGPPPSPGSRSSLPDFGEWRWNPSSVRSAESRNPAACNRLLWPPFAGLRNVLFEKGLKKSGNHGLLS